MTSAFTFGKVGANPLANKYAGMARQSSQVGSKWFIYTPANDEVIPWPRHTNRQGDNPFLEFFGWIRLRWCIHDFRMFGLFDALRRHYYIGEVWRRKDEKIFAGKDHDGNKYWYSRRTRGSQQNRFVEPVDPHWFRGQEAYASSPQWQKWLNGNMAHTPAMIKARGEWGLNARQGIPIPFDIKYAPYAGIDWGRIYARDPTWCAGPGILVNPEQKALLEAGYSRWVINKGHPLFMPFCGPHDFSDELVEEYHRGHWAFGRRNKGHDHDEWKA